MLLTTMDFLTMMRNLNTWSETPAHIHRMLNQVSAQTYIDEETVELIEAKLGPAMEEMVKLGPGHYQSHPSISKVYKWLVDPQRMPQEFNYVVGPKGKYKFDTLGRHENLYLGLLAAEALAVRNPVLDGLWETAAWFIVWLNSRYFKEYNYGFASDNLSDWIIRVMGDPVLCPNPSLRLEFMNMFGKMVCVNAENRMKALNAVVSACFSLSLEDSEFLRFFFETVSLYSISSILEKFVTYGQLLALDQSIANKIASRVSGIIRDVSCSYGMNPIRYTELQEAAMVKWFVHITLLFAFVEINKLTTEQFYSGQENEIEDVTHTLWLLVTNFKKTCQSPRAVGITSNCVMYVLELVLQVNVALLNERGHIYPKTLHDTHKLLLEFCDETNGYNIVLSSVGRILQIRYQDRLCNLRQMLGNYLPESTVICNLLYHCNLVEQNIISSGL